MKSQLRDHIVKLVPGFEKEIDKVLHYFEEQNFPKNHMVIDEGDFVDQFYFVIKGCLHIYFKDHQGKDNTIHFAIEDWWVTEYNAFLGTIPSNFGIATLEETKVLMITKDNLEKLLLDYPFMGVYFNKIHMRAYGASLQKQKTYPMTSKKDFHAYFCKTYPDLVKRFPEDVFASYIGISTDELRVFNENFRS
ncbi:cyclic nucleotide-binding domain-containing protein [Chryseobacterium sp. C-71]|uniref:Crp/Fnr family transcriptional regulator n=1 Tax=Chryseobacterium sp. C-71 TaxID=2893882 RepID=UPI001E60095E|nr:cyclic nucleotide-binding domain-containing protein [Chryseobacterium sp. C-71]UFH33508.1 cyclic nucleotide-binding domain-containing protein [Chryseobacterium sp. C-71]